MKTNQAIHLKTAAILSQQWGPPLDHHGFEWRELSISDLIAFLQDKDDQEFTGYFSDEKTDSTLDNCKEERCIDSSHHSRKGLPQLNQAQCFERLKEIINIRGQSVPSVYMDKLLLENIDFKISQILDKLWSPYAVKIHDRHFRNIAMVKKHIKYREERGWIFSLSGDPSDPVVRLVGFKKN